MELLIYLYCNEDVVRKKNNDAVGWSRLSKVLKICSVSVKCLGA